MALSLVGGAAIGALFGALYDVVKISIGKTAMQYKPLLSDLKFTLDSLRPRIIQQIREHNVELGIPNEDTESLQRQMVEGTELVRMLSNRGTWSCYVLCSCCNRNKPSYAEQLVELDRSLRILLEILKLQEARDVKEVLVLARKINDKQGELERRLADLLKVQQESGDGGQSSGSGAETTPNEQNGENGGQQVAPSGGGVGAAALGAAFGVLFDTVMQVKDKTTMLKRPLGDLNSTLDSVKPLIEEVAECSKVLNLPNEELEDVRIQMEKGAELVGNCSRIRHWTTYKMYEYTNKLLGLDESLQRLLNGLRVQLARDVRDSLVSVSNIEAVINQIEGSGVVKLQNEQNEAKGSCEAPTAMAKSAVGLNALSVEGTRDVTETLDLEVNIKVGCQKVEESWVAQSKTEHPSRTVGLDAMNIKLGARSTEETSVSDVEPGLKRTQRKEVSKLDAPFRVLGKDVRKDEEDEELDEQVEDHHDRKKKEAESVTGVSGDGMAICKADGCAVDLSDAKAYNRRHMVCELHSKTPLVIVSGLKRRFCHKCSRPCNPRNKEMKCFFPFKEKRKSKKEVSQSAPELRNKSNSSNPALDRATKSSSSLPSPKSIPELYKEKEHNLRVFSFQELREATHGFNRLLKLGEGGFGGVYKGAIRPSDGGTGSPIYVAIKKLNHHSLQGHKQWLAEVQFLGIVNHPNLVKLLGYCCFDGEEGIQRLLVYEFMPNRSLEDHLFNRALPALPWMTRLKIMLGAAQGLAYLHKELEVQVIHRDFKSSNVLLDEEFRPKLSDFWLAKEGPMGDRSHVSTAVVGTYGYAAPEYIHTGHLSTSSDLWSFGVVLYEILTGRRVLDRNRPISEQKLLYWVRQFPADSKRFSMVMDPRLRDQYSLTAAQNVAKLADSCLNNNAKERPTVSQVAEVLEQALQDSQGSTNSFKGGFEVSTSKLAKREPK